MGFWGGAMGGGWGRVGGGMFEWGKRSIMLLLYSSFSLRGGVSLFISYLCLCIVSPVARDGTTCRHIFHFYLP